MQDTCTAALLSMFFGPYLGSEAPIAEPTPPARPLPVPWATTREWEFTLARDGEAGEGLYRLRGAGWRGYVRANCLAEGDALSLAVCGDGVVCVAVAHQPPEVRQTARAAHRTRYPSPAGAAHKRHAVLFARAPLFSQPTTLGIIPAPQAAGALDPPEAPPGDAAAARAPIAAAAAAAAGHGGQHGFFCECGRDFPSRSGLLQHAVRHCAVQV